jgi:hypothetical protein
MLNTNGTISPYLVNYWPFCGSTKDIIGLNDITAVNYANLTNDQSSNPLSAFQLNYGYGQASPGNYFTFTAANAGEGFTIMFWMKLLTLPLDTATMMF